MPAYIRNTLKAVAHLLRVVSVHLHQLANIKPGRAQDLDLPHVYALKRVDTTALLLNVLTYNQNTASVQLLHECEHCFCALIDQ